MANNTTAKTQHLVSEFESIHKRLQDLEQSIVEDTAGEQMPINLFSQGSVGIFIAQDGVIKSANKQMCSITGYSDHELTGISPLTLVLPEDRTQVEKGMARCLDKGSISVQEFRIMCRNGSTKWVMASISPIHQNGSQAMIANLINITDHRQFMESQKKIEERYHDLCENSNVMIQCITPAGQITYTNQAWRDLMGYRQEEITNLSVFQIVPPDYRGYFHELIQRAISGESISDVEAVILGRNGARISVDGNINCRFIDGKPIYMRVVFHDVTKRKEEQVKAEALLEEAQELNKRLQDSNRELEDFAHIASHDLQEPLRKISSFGGLLKESLLDRLDDDEMENLDFMVDGAMRMQAMINELLTYSRITTRAKSFQAVDTNKVVEDLKKLELASILQEAKGALVIPKQLPTVTGDPSQLYQLFQNLILNGFKFHKEGMPPVVTINCHPAQNNKIIFYVRDNGIGIDSEYHEKIFTMFKRLHSREQYEGTGIGLAICKKIVLRHGGEIGVKSKDGEGSDFWFTLPRFDGSKETDVRGAGDE